MTVLNRDDPDWFWVLRHCDSSEGFVPSGFVYPGHVLNSYATAGTTTTVTTSISGEANIGKELVHRKKLLNAKYIHHSFSRESHQLVHFHQVEAMVLYRW